MFYTTIGIIVVNFFLLSLHSPVSKKEKFTKHEVFREALYKGLFDHATGAVGAGGADIASMVVAGPVTAAEALSTAGTGIKHQRIGMKRGPCVVCKQIAREERRGVSVGGKKGQALQAVSPNIASKSKDRHVHRAKTGCDACRVLLCSTKQCWEAYHGIA